jgi:hypothetical protein
MKIAAKMANGPQHALRNTKMAMVRSQQDGLKCENQGPMHCLTCLLIPAEWMVAPKRLELV